MPADRHRSMTGPEVRAELKSLRPCEPGPAPAAMAEFVEWELQHHLTARYLDRRPGEFPLREADLKEVNEFIASTIDIYLDVRIRNAGEPTDPDSGDIRRR